MSADNGPGIPEKGSEICEQEIDEASPVKKRGNNVVPQTAELEVEEMPEIELSSDDEASDDEVALIVLKRPPVTEKKIEEIEMTEEDEVLVCAQGEGWMANAKEQQGYVKEYIETEGLATILHKEHGLVLFHLRSVWLEGAKLDMSRTRSTLPVGSEINFLMRGYKGPDYKALSEEAVLHQAVAVWSGDRPKHLLKEVGKEEYRRDLEEQRKGFMLYIRGEVFLSAALVRVKCEVAGYLSDSLGVMEHKTFEGTKVNIFFHAEDVKIFKKDLRSYGRQMKQVLPVGCLVSCDARKVYISELKKVEYQAMLVLAGSWPSVPHPTLLPGGRGSVAPIYDIPAGHTFYYLELALDSKLQRKVSTLKELVGRTRGQLQYEMRGVNFISSREEFTKWQEEMGGSRYKQGTEFRGQYPKGPRELLDAFKSNDMQEEELNESGSTKKVVTRMVPTRTWYTPDAWQHGGLKVKQEFEVKEEEDEEGGPPKAKKMKRETGKGEHSA